jgi:hypothetical protein
MEVGMDTQGAPQAIEGTGGAAGSHRPCFRFRRAWIRFQGAQLALIFAACDLGLTWAFFMDRQPAEGQSLAQAWMQIEPAVLFLGLVGIYSVLVCLTNRTVLTMSDGVLTVRRGSLPVPFAGSRSFPLAAIADFRVTHARSSKGTQWSCTDVVLRDGSSFGLARFGTFIDSGSIEAGDLADTLRRTRNEHLGVPPSATAAPSQPTAPAAGT